MDLFADMADLADDLARDTAARILARKTELLLVLNYFRHAGYFQSA